MTIRYFADTDTALIDFSEHAVSETIEVSENVYIDVDTAGNLVSMTIEHAKSSGALSELVYRDMGRQSA
jgi:uncharacterized protein YuzE